jgi:hypothetical protein
MDVGCGAQAHHARTTTIANRGRQSMRLTLTITALRARIRQPPFWYELPWLPWRNATTQMSLFVAAPQRELHPSLGRRAARCRGVRIRRTPSLLLRVWGEQLPQNVLQDSSVAIVRSSAGVSIRTTASNSVTDDPISAHTLTWCGRGPDARRPGQESACSRRSLIRLGTVSSCRIGLR